MSNKYQKTLFCALVALALAANILVVTPVSAGTTDDFVITVQTVNPGESFTIPTMVGDITIMWIVTMTARMR